MPGAPRARHELDQFPVAPDQEVRRNPEIRDRREIRVRTRVEAITLLRGRRLELS